MVKQDSNPLLHDSESISLPKMARLDVMVCYEIQDIFATGKVPKKTLKVAKIDAKPICVEHFLCWLASFEKCWIQPRVC